MVAEPELRAQASVIEAANDAIAAFAEMGPAVVAGRDDRGRSQDRGRGRRADAVQAQRAVAELARDARGLPDLLYIDAGRGEFASLFTGDDPRAVEYREDFQLLLEDALSPDRSVSLIRDVADEMS